MTTIDSTATLPEVKTAPPVNGIDLPTVVSGDPAPRHDGKNLFIEIDVRSNEAVFHCQDPEHVGTHKQRHVLFCANKHCWLIFTNPSVFTEPYLELMKGEDQAAHVLDETAKVETSYRIRVSAAKTAKAAKMMNAVTTPKRPPVIVVP
jgi:hypothetical protein